MAKEKQPRWGKEGRLAVLLFRAVRLHRNVQCRHHLKAYGRAAWVKWARLEQTQTGIKIVFKMFYI